MRALVLSKYGGFDHIQLKEWPVPKLKSNQLLVQVKAAGLNPIDLKIPQKKMWPILRFKFPMVLGTDISGQVIQVGSDVRKFKVGDEVYASLSTSLMGGFAETVAIDADSVALKPKSLNYEEAASIPLVGLTVYQGLKSFANVSPGQKVFIKAGSGGIGTFAIQFAKILGAEVATTTSSKNTEFVRSLGADQIIDYHQKKFEDVLSGYDVVLDSVDGEDVSRSFKILKPGGILVTVVGPPTYEFAQALGLSWPLKIISGLLGLKVMRLAKQNHSKFHFVFVKPSGVQLNEIKDLIDAGKLKPVIDKTFLFDDWKSAFEYLSAGRAKGKVVLKIGGHHV